MFFIEQADVKAFFLLIAATMWSTGEDEYIKVPKFSDTRKRCCNPPKIQTRRPKLRVFYQNDANGIANSEDPDQTAPLGAV